MFLQLFYNLDYVSIEQVSDKDLEGLYAETNIYVLASHLYWALWALIQVDNFFKLCSEKARWSCINRFFPHFYQARMSPIDFDYLAYFFLRYDEYKKQKKKSLSLVQSYLSGSGTG